MTSSEALTLHVRLAGADLAARDLSKIEDAAGRIGKAAKCGAAEASSALATFHKSTTATTAMVQQATRSQGGAWSEFFGGLKDGWRQARTFSQQSASQVAVATGQATQAATTGGTASAGGFWAGLRDGWRNARNQAEAASAASAAATHATAGAEEESDSGGRRSGGKFWGGFKSALAGIAGFAVIGSFIKGSIDAYLSSSQTAANLADAFTRFPRLADTSIGKINELGAARAKLTRFDADSTSASVANLAQLRLSGAQITDLIPLIQDYAAKTGTDMASATNSVSDAFLGNTSALRDAGITFKATGSAGYDYAQMMKVLRAQVGGFAEKDGKSAAGQLAIMQNSFDNVKASLGEKLMPILLGFSTWMLSTGIPALQRFADWIGTNVVPILKSMADWIGTNVVPALQALGEWIQKNSDWLVPFGITVGGLAIAWTAFTGAVALSRVVFATHPVFIMAAAVAEIIASIPKIDSWNPLNKDNWVPESPSKIARAG